MYKNYSWDELAGLQMNLERDLDYYEKSIREQEEELNFTKAQVAGLEAGIKAIKKEIKKREYFYG